MVNGSESMNIGYVGEFRSIRPSKLQGRCRHWGSDLDIASRYMWTGCFAYVGGVGVLIPKAHVVDN